MDVRRFVALLGGLGVVAMRAEDDENEMEDDTTMRPRESLASPLEAVRFLGGAIGVGGGG